MRAGRAVSASLALTPFFKRLEAEMRLFAVLLILMVGGCGKSEPPDAQMPSLIGAR